MSGISEEKKCPICGELMTTYSDWKPFDMVSGECIYCGFYIETKIGQMTLKEVNEKRNYYNEDYDPNEKLKPLTQKDLKKWTEDIKRI